MEEWNWLHHTPSDPSNKEEYFKSQSIKATTLFQLQNLQIKSAEKERNNKRNLVEVLFHPNFGDLVSLKKKWENGSLGSYFLTEQELSQY